MVQEQDINSLLKEILKDKNRLPASRHISPYDYTNLSTICKLRNIELKELLELLNKLNIEVKYQVSKKGNKLYILGDDDTKVSREILTARSKAQNKTG